MPTHEEQVEYQRAWMAARRQRAVDYLGGKCAWCERTQDEVLLEFDHIRPRRVTGRPTIGSILSGKWERQIVELTEVWLLCRDCHRAKTRDDLPDLMHGTSRKYDLGCRCDECREFKRQKNAKRFSKAMPV